MTDQVLNILKYVLLGLLYLFFARVLWAVWSEVRAPVRGSSRIQQSAKVSVPNPAAPTIPAARPAAAAAAPSKKRSRASKKPAAVPTRLVVLEPAIRRGLAVTLTTEITLGREPGCAIVIDDDAFVSQHHLRVFDYDGQPMVEDLGSTNGTYHNGVKLIGAKLLHAGDRLQVGTTVIEAQ